MAKPKPDLSPPWIIYSDRRGPIAILPAGRPGEVANVEGMPLRKVRAIVNAANQPIRDARVEMVKLTKELLALNEKLKKESPSGDGGGKDDKPDATKGSR